MTKVTDRERIIEFLKGWAGNSAEMEELVQMIAESDGFEDITLELIDEQIKYSYKLNEVGRKIADKWAADWGYTPWTTEGEFLDEDRGSVESTAGDFGLEEDLRGKTWGDITEEKREELMSVARAVDGRTGDTARGGKCIVDFEGTPYSIAGELIVGDEEDEIRIDDCLVIYSSTEE